MMKKVLKYGLIFGALYLIMKFAWWIAIIAAVGYVAYKEFFAKK